MANQRTEWRYIHFIDPNIENWAQQNTNREGSSIEIRQTPIIASEIRKRNPENKLKGQLRNPKKFFEMLIFRSMKTEKTMK